MRATIKDVAHEAGVAQATAARALGGYGYVSNSARDRVQIAAEKLGYRANNAARTLVSGTSNTIGFAVGDIENVFFAASARGLADTVEDAGYTLLVANSDEEADRERRAVDSLASHRVDGLVVAPANSMRAPHLRDLHASGMPLVLLDRTVRGLQVDSVVTDSAAGARLAVEDLAANGHERIGVVIDNLDVPITSMTSRLVGWRKALDALGLPSDDSLVAIGVDRHSDGCEPVRRLLSRDNPPTAVFSASNLMTLGILHTLKELGLRVGRDLALVAFDDMDVLSLVEPSITAVAQPARELGETAGKLLLGRLGGATGPPRRVKLVPKLVVRESSGPVRRPAKQAA